MTAFLMSVSVRTTTLTGIEAIPIEIEADISPGLPKFVIVGLPDAAVRESAERVKAAMKNCGLPFPTTRLTVNLAPAELRKGGTGFDLPIALAILAQMAYFDVKTLDKTFCVGELSLAGELRSVRGALAIALTAKRAGSERLLLPSSSAPEAALVPEMDVYGFSDLHALIRHLRGDDAHIPLPQTTPSSTPDSPFDFRDIAGLDAAKRAMELAAAGAHNILISGPPGAGKTLLAKSLPGILPSMTWEETLEVTRIHGVAGTLPEGEATVSTRPWYAPHHTASPAAVIGGGTDPRPGAVTLAHRGVLFLDEFPEFPRTVLESLRQPLEDREVTVSRASGTSTFPAEFMLVAAQNPCPCGFHSDPERACTCPPMLLERYRKRVSGPILDRIDLRLDVPRTRYADLSSVGSAEPSSEVRARVEAARKRQAIRSGQYGFLTNAAIPARLLKRLCPLPEDAHELLTHATERYLLSARSAHRIIRVARTAADLEGQDRIDARHVAEALGYRISEN